MAQKDRRFNNKSDIEDQIAEMNENKKKFFKTGKNYLSHSYDENNDEAFTVYDDLPEYVEIVGIKFHEAGKIYYFSPNGIACSVGTKVIVRTTKGLEMGEVMISNKEVKSSEIVLPLRSIERAATDEDTERYQHNLILDKEAFEICQKMISDHKLEMKLVNAKYSFDNSQLLFSFTADKRIDFRELVKDLAACFRTRIELRQIGIRDQAKAMGGLGVCGRPFCCTTFLSDFAQVSIKMAKEQNLSLNSSKISGTCGRLMCCLRFEHETYEEELKKMPCLDAKVKTPDGIGFITEISPLTHLVKVKITDKSDSVIIKIYDKDDVTVLDKKQNVKDNTDETFENIDTNSNNDEN